VAFSEIDGLSANYVAWWDGVSWATVGTGTNDWILALQVWKAAAYKIRHANVLLAVDESAGGRRRTDAEVARTLGVTTRSIEMLRRRFVEQGLD